MRAPVRVTQSPIMHAEGSEFAPFGPPEITAEVGIYFRALNSRFMQLRWLKQEIRSVAWNFVDFQIVPPLSLDLNPAFDCSTGRGSITHEFQVSVINNQKSGAQGILKLLTPSGCQADPGEIQFSLSASGDVCGEIPGSCTGRGQVWQLSHRSCCPDGQ